MNLPAIFRSYFRSLPDDPIAIELARQWKSSNRPKTNSSSEKILIQAVQDPYYFSLFSTIFHEIRKIEEVSVELFVFCSIEASMGNGIKASLKRSYPFVWLITRQWIKIYQCINAKVGYRSVSWNHPIADFLSWIKSTYIWNGLQSIENLERLTIDGVNCGDLIIDTYLRFSPAATVNLSDHFLRHLIWQAHRDVYRAKRYFSRSPPKLFLSSYSTYIQHGIAVRVALQKGVKVVTFGNFLQLGKVLNTGDTFHTKNPVYYRNEFSQREDQDELLQMAHLQLENRLSGGVDAATKYMLTSAYAEGDGVCPNVKGRPVIYLHDFFDSPHIYPQLVFPDFWTWVCFTIETLQAADISFLIKRHPNQGDSSEEVVRKLQHKYFGLEFIPNAVTTRQLSAGGMACVISVHGTIIHEAAYLGVPAIACARHPHVAFDFCFTAKTREEYRLLLLNSCQLSFSDKNLIQRQVLEFYAMHNLQRNEDERVSRTCLIELWTCFHTPGRSAKSILEILDSLRVQRGFQCLVGSLLE
jgi:hypothetical protein